MDTLKPAVPADLKIYRFVYNRESLKKQACWLWISVVFNIFLLAVFFFVFSRSVEQYPNSAFMIFLVLCFVLPVLFFPLVSLRYYRRLSIIVDREGISCNGFWFNALPKYARWDELTQIRYKNINIGGRYYQQQTIIFTQKYGRQFLLPISALQRDLYTGDGHTLSLLQVIEKFTGTIEQIKPAEEDQTPALFGVVDLGREVGLVAFVALGFMILAFIFMFLPVRALALDNAYRFIVYAVAGVGAFVLACGYMRRVKNKFAVLMSAFLVGGCSVFLMMPLLDNAPMWFGKKQAETFVIVNEEAEAQRWQAQSNPNLTFSIYVEAPRRIYQGVGTKRRLTLYRTAVGFNAMPKSELDTLFTQ